MANELVLTVSVEYLDANDVSHVAGVDALRRSISAKRPIKYTQSIDTTEEQLTLGEAATIGYVWVRNLDGTNFVELRVASGGAKFCKLMPGDVALFPLGSGAQTPYAIADTAACDIEVLFIPR